MKRDDTVYLQHILDAIAKTQSYLLDIDEASFLANSLVQDGVIRQIEIIGEAARHLSAELRGQHAVLRWLERQVGGCRALRAAPQRIGIEGVLDLVAGQYPSEGLSILHGQE
jgi:uncharacterized protein with HEPN domain